MSIRTKILLLLATALAVGLAALIAILNGIVAPAFDRLDLEQAEKNVNRMQRTLANELSVLDQKAVDWGHWDETYAFAASGDPAYVADNLQPGSLINLGVSLMAFYDDEGRAVWIGGADPETEEAIDFPGFHDADEMLPVSGRKEARLSGLLEVAGKHYLISAAAILTSSEAGPPQGTLVVGRELDDTLLASLAERTEVIFALTGLPHSDAGDDPSMPELAAKTSASLHHRIALHAIGGDGGIGIEIRTPRTAYELGQRAVRLAAMLLIAAVALIMAVIAISINRMVIRPLRDIHKAMQDVAHSTDLDRRLDWRLDWRRGDEIGQVAGEFDRMLEQIAQARRALLETTYRLGKSDLATGMLHNLRNALHPLANQLHRAAAALQPADNHLARALVELQAPGTEAERRPKLVQFLGTAWQQNGARLESARLEINAAAGQLAAIEQILNRADQGSESAQEDLSCAHLVKEGLALFSADRLAQFDVRFALEMEALPPVSVPRLPVIHVVYNVIANAITAVEAAGRERGQIHVAGRHRPQEGIVQIAIADNGIGIGRDALPSIFQAGYTTKAGNEGGEGLHWCANTLAAAGGSIRAESDGIGRGATITIELPAAPGR